MAAVYIISEFLTKNFNKMEIPNIEKPFFEKLISDGEIFNENLHNINNELFTLSKNKIEYFATACALSLIWSEHAKKTNEFIEFAINFIANKISLNINITKNNFQRFGKDGLENALIAFKKLTAELHNFQDINFSTCNINELLNIQNKLLNKIIAKKDHTNYVGFGAWLFLAPFKIILGNEKRLWHSTDINEIILPTGVGVENGLRKLKRKKYEFMTNFNIKLLLNNKDFITSFGNAKLIHFFISELADKYGTKALVLNSSFYDY